ncbi:MAG: sodium/proline symporter PutP [Lachnospiraceae bacterium]|nr:sodium/proline symporter PutP [Lachnospiraceae bacterium]MBQ9233437.1 sodium/proline symporter PutP [Lachnospiraceae bacterium]
MTGWIVFAFVLYMSGMLIIGISTAKKNKNADDYFLGGRNLGGWVAALSAQASDMSGWLLMGLPGCIYAFGTNQAWIAIGLFIGTVLNWIFIAGRLRRYTIRAGNALTIPEYLSNRFGDKKKILMAISAVVILIFFLVYTASAFAAGGKLFSSIAKIDYHTALFVGAAVILAYTFLGGFLAVCKTDFIQGMMMLIGILAVPIVAVMLMGTGSIIPNLIDSGVEDASDFLNIFVENGKPITAMSIASQLAWGLGYCGMPHILVRFMAIKDEKELSKSKKVAIVWVLLSLVVACIIGVIGRAYLFPTVLSTEGSQYENVYIEMIMKMFTEDIKIPFIGGLLLCGILAAIMSTADSQLLVSSSSISQDLFKGVFFKDLKEKTVLLIARVCVFVIAIIAFFIAWNPDSSIMGLVSDAWAGLGAAFGPTILMSLYWKRINLPGAAAGMISGAGTVILWDYIKLVDMDGAKVTLATYTGAYSLLIGFFVSLAFIVIVSLITPKVSEEIEKEFDDVKNGIV